MPRIKDPVFGQIEYEWDWTGTITLEPFGGECEFCVEADDGEPPSDDQRRVFRELLANAKKLKTQVEAALFEYYHRVRPIYEENASHYAEGFDKAMPKLAKSSEIWSLLDDAQLIIPTQDDPKLRKLNLAWNCTWDAEHGVEAFIENWRVVHVDIIGAG